MDMPRFAMSLQLLTSNLGGYSAICILINDILKELCIQEIKIKKVKTIKMAFNVFCGETVHILVL